MSESPAVAPVADAARLAAARDEGVPRPVVVRVPFERGGRRAGSASAATASLHAFPAGRGHPMQNVRPPAPQIEGAGDAMRVIPKLAMPREGRAGWRAMGFSGDVCSVCNSAEMVRETERLACRNCGTTTRIA
ncbi:hypothetical protein [Labrys monachus]|uniref:Uncharacterized protein n=1 Tax=Labrys monachus TaxID=217067 RepID=A0ABU0F871_9HYPH|nr:hypothetical protein [Labrys monachus]MDQ0390808.1 hypothetical protein [Labrys monachus]